MVSHRFTPTLPSPLKGEGKYVEDVASPCTSVCKMNPDAQLCEGCFRTLDEIAAWSGLSAEEKRAVLEQLPARKPAP